MFNFNNNADRVNFGNWLFLVCWDTLYGASDVGDMWDMFKSVVEQSLFMCIPLNAAQPIQACSILLILNSCYLRKKLWKC